MKYTLHQLEVFLAVCKYQSITRAAEELDLTQPAVSIQLKNLQQQFNVPLTETVSRQIYITDFGREIAEISSRVLSEVDAINAKALGHLQVLTGQLRVSVVSTGKYVMPYFLSSFLSKYHGVELKMDVTNRQKVLNDLANNDVDFALVSLSPGKVVFEEMELLTNKLYLVGNADQKFDVTSKTKELFDRWPLIMREVGSGTRTSMEKFLERNRIVPARKIELTSNEAVKQAILAGLGLSIMPLIGLRNELKDKTLKILPYKGLPLKTSWRLVWHKQKKHNAVGEALIAHLKSNRKTIVDTHFSWFKQF